MSTVGSTVANSYFAVGAVLYRMETLIFRIAVVFFLLFWSFYNHKHLVFSSVYFVLSSLGLSSKIVYGLDDCSKDLLFELDEIIDDEPVERLPVASPKVEYTNVNRMAARLVAMCKLELVFHKYSEANKLVVERWVNKHLSTLPSLRLKHKTMVKHVFMSLIFIPDKYELEAKKIFASLDFQDRLVRGSQLNYHFVWNASSWYLPWLRREVAPTKA